MPSLDAFHTDTRAQNRRTRNERTGASVLRNLGRHLTVRYGYPQWYCHARAVAGMLVLSHPCMPATTLVWMCHCWQLATNEPEFRNAMAPA